MKIYQGYKSNVMLSFEFMQIHKLRPYDNINEPLVVFGCYTVSDVMLIMEHQSTVVIQWEGLDSKKHQNLSIFKKDNIINVSPHRNICAYFKTKGLECQEIKWAINETIAPQKLGEQIYTYIHKDAQLYYGSGIINQIKTKYSFLIGNYTIPQEQFRGAIRNSFYSKVFVGIQACDYAGGGMGIVELGLRGIKVITNILDLPHTISFKTLNDIEEAINKEAEKIGTVNSKLAQDVYDAVLCSEKIICYNLKQLIK